MKRSVLLFLFVSFIICSSIYSGGEASAQVAEVELQQFLIEINWTSDELMDYLQFHEVSLEEFDSITELRDFLGTPITSENLNGLLSEYNIDQNDLQTLLAEFGETIDDYQFIEDLNLDVEFFLNYQEDFIVVNDFLSLFALTEDEIQTLFDHFRSLEDESRKENLNELTMSLDAVNYLRGADQLSTEEEESLLSLWNDMFEALQIDASFFLEKDDEKIEVELNDLIEKQSFDGYNLLMFLHNYEGELLATLAFSEEMFDSHLMYESLEHIVEVASLADEYHGMLQTAKLPVTAAHYLSNILFSLFLIISGIAILVLVKRRVNA